MCRVKMTKELRSFLFLYLSSIKDERRGVGHPLSGTKEMRVAPFAPFADRGQVEAVGGCKLALDVRRLRPI